MNLNPPTPEQLSFLQNLNNEDLNTRDRDLEIIKQWLKQEPHLPDDFDDKALLNFLRWGKFSLEKTKRRLDMYFTVRSSIPDFFTDRDITKPELKLSYEKFPFAFLPRLTPNGRRIAVASSPTCDFGPQDIVNFAKAIIMVADVRVDVEEGVHDTYILDASMVQLKNVPNISIPAIKKFLVCALEAYPVRIKEYHVINAPPLVSLVIKWVSRFVKDKIIKRIRIHENLESLHECVPKDLLPEEFGGSAGKLSDFRKQWMVTLEERREWFKEGEKLKADESKRVAQDNIKGKSFGMDGSFRQLMID